MAYFKLDEPRDVELQLSPIPTWISRLALPVLLGIVIGFPILLHIIRYPEIEIVKVNIFTSGNNTTDKTATELKLDSLFVKPGSYVTRGQPVGINVEGDTLMAFKNGELNTILDFNSDKIFVNISSRPKSYVVRGAVNFESAAKVAINQKVKIEIFSKIKSGQLIGRISNISSIPINDKYTFEVELENDVDPSNNVNLYGNEKLEGQAKIFVAEKSLLQRIFESLKRT